MASSRLAAEPTEPAPRITVLSAKAVPLLLSSGSSPTPCKAL